MSAPRGSFVWYELMTGDTAAALAFYQAVIGWSGRESGLADRHYTLLSAGEAPVAGMIALPASALASGARPAWIGYIGVDDVDAMVERVVQAGGTLHRVAETIPGVGRFAVLHDPQDAPFVLFTPAEGGQVSSAPGFTPGHVGWRELLAGDSDAAFAFYADLFGWTKAEAIDMGPMGLYQLFATGGPAVGGMMTKPAAVPHAFWTYYINVDAIDAAMTRATEAGGTIVNGPHQVPGGSWIAQAFDPQGAVFAMVAPGR